MTAHLIRASACCLLVTLTGCELGLPTVGGDPASAKDGGGSEPTCSTGWKASGGRCVRASPGAGYGATCVTIADCGCLTPVGDNDRLCESSKPTLLDCFNDGSSNVCSVDCANDSACHLATGRAASFCRWTHCVN